MSCPRFYRSSFCFHFQGVEGFQRRARTKKHQQVQIFIGFSNFYLQFIHHVLLTTQALHYLTTASTLFVWSKKFNKDSESLNIAFTLAPILRILHLPKLLCLRFNFLKFSLGAFLSQLLKEEGKLYPVACIYKSLICASGTTKFLMNKIWWSVFLQVMKTQHCQHNFLGFQHPIHQMAPPRHLEPGALIQGKIFPWFDPSHQFLGL